MPCNHSRRRGAGVKCIVAAAATLLLGACSRADAPDSVASLDAEDRALLADLLIEEDRRPGLEQATTLHRGLASDNPLIRRFAVRGLGRLEDPDALDDLATALDDESAAVRSQAANAVAQSVFNESSSAAADVLRGRLAEEPDPAVRGALAQALGRLRPSAPGALDDTQATLIEITRDAPIETLLPTMRGLEWLARANRAELALTEATAGRLVELAHYGRGAEGSVEPRDGGAPDPDLTLAAARVRRLALATLSAASTIDADTVETALYDPDPEVRHLAAAAAGSAQVAAQQPILLRIALDDDDPSVRYEGLRWYGRRLRLLMGCAPVLAAVDDEDTHVALQAIDLLALGCPSADAATGDDGRAAAVLRDLAESTPGLPDDNAVRDPDADGITAPISADASAAARPVAWHRGAHALSALTQLDADAAVRLIGLRCQCMC